MKIVSRQPSEAVPARIAPLAVLPVFLDLNGRRAVVAGGSDAAAWKAELLAAAGARVHVHAPRSALGPEFLRLLAQGVVVHHDGTFDPAALEGAAVAVADAETEQEAAGFALAARRAGVPCNVIDKPEHCAFQFGSIVNRSPVVVAVSTGGAAPILGQAVRRRIETLLPPSLAGWAGLAQRLRDKVNAAFAPGPARRAFWERLVDRAFGPAPSSGTTGHDDLLWNELAGGVGDCIAGKVTFVGAGPGDPEHLTLKAVRALQAADVILFDDLVSDGVLELARREARRILVGKRSGRPSCKQDEINGMMVGLAKAGRHVVRLKSGDPMIFGRGGEEIDRLRAEGIPYSVVPGVTTALALAAAAGISLTHRDLARSVRFVTGHSKHGGLPEDIDIPAIADPAATTIVYMAARTAGDLAARLAGCGMDPASHVAVGVALGRPEEQVLFAPLQSLETAIAALDLSMPVVIGIGKVFDATAARAAISPACCPAGRSSHDRDGSGTAISAAARP